MEEATILDCHLSHMFQKKFDLDYFTSATEVMKEIRNVQAAEGPANLTVGLASAQIALNNGRADGTRTNAKSLILLCVTDY
ncbi:unnamed protein product, partial [Strongylus vulgaris]